MCRDDIETNTHHEGNRKTPLAYCYEKQRQCFCTLIAQHGEELEQLEHNSLYMGGGEHWGGGDLFTFFNAIFLMHLQQALMLSRALDQQINIELCDLPH